METKLLQEIISTKFKQIHVHYYTCKMATKLGCHINGNYRIGAIFHGMYMYISRMKSLAVTGDFIFPNGPVPLYIRQTFYVCI